MVSPAVFWVVENEQISADVVSDPTVGSHQHGRRPEEGLDRCLLYPVWEAASWSPSHRLEPRNICAPLSLRRQVTFILFLSRVRLMQKPVQNFALSPVYLCVCGESTSIVDITHGKEQNKVWAPGVALSLIRSRIQISGTLCDISGPGHTWKKWGETPSAHMQPWGHLTSPWIAWPYDGGSCFRHVLLDDLSLFFSLLLCMLSNWEIQSLSYA